MSTVLTDSYVPQYTTQSVDSPSELYELDENTLSDEYAKNAEYALSDEYAKNAEYALSDEYTRFDENALFAEYAKNEKEDAITSTELVERGSDSYCMFVLDL